MNLLVRGMNARSIYRTAILTLAVLGFLLGRAVQASTDWIVVDARGVPFSSGAHLAPGAALKLPEGARVTLIARSGRTVTLRGLFEGLVPRVESEQEDPRRALSALIAARQERIRTIGVVRSGEKAARLPDPWLIDISRPGPRCLHQSLPAAFWLPHPIKGPVLTIWPTDRSWRLNLDWPANRDRIEIPDALRPTEGQTLIAADGDREHAITFTLIAAGVMHPVLLAAWLIEKGCVQQADALIDQLNPPTDSKLVRLVQR
jgi:hypothetical protein